MSADFTGACSRRQAEFWADVEANFLPEFNRLSSKFYALEKTASMWAPFVKYVRRHPEQCFHRRR